MKKQEPAKARLEVLKTERARSIGIKSSGFRVPAVLAHLDGAGIILFERVSDIVPLKTLARHRDHGPRYAHLAGRALGAIHEQLALPRDYMHPLPQAWQDENAPQVFLHGDFNAYNVQVCVQRQEVTVLDWAMTDVWGGQATHGPTYFDAAWMVHTLFFRNSLWNPRSPRVESVCTAFIGGYLQEMSNATEAGFWNYLRRAHAVCSADHRRRKHPIEYQLYRPAFDRLARFIARHAP